MVAGGYEYGGQVGLTMKRELCRGEKVLCLDCFGYKELTTTMKVQQSTRVIKWRENIYTHCANANFLLLRIFHSNVRWNYWKKLGTGCTSSLCTMFATSYEPRIISE